MTRDEAQAFCDNRQVEKDVWEDKNTKQQRLSLSYWYWHEKKCYRVFEAGAKLEEVVAKCIDVEGDIKAGRPKTMKPPAPRVITPAMVCNFCNYINYVTPSTGGTHYCTSCGSPLA